MKEISSRVPNLPSMRVLIILFSRFPDLHMDAVNDLDVAIHYSNTYVCVGTRPSSRSHHIVNMSNRICKVTTNLAPKGICSEIRIDIHIQMR